MKNVFLLFFGLVLFASAATARADFMHYDSGTGTWSVTNWGPFANAGSGAFAPSTFSGYTSLGGVGMMRNDNLAGWWIGEIDVSTWSTFYAPDTYTITVTGATWGGIVSYLSTYAAGSAFYAASDNPGDIIDATGLNIGDSINGVFSWSGDINNMQLNYTALIPEPATSGLIGLAVFGLAFVRRRK